MRPFNRVPKARRAHRGDNLNDPFCAFYAGSRDTGIISRGSCESSSLSVCAYATQDILRGQPVHARDAQSDTILSSIRLRFRREISLENFGHCRGNRLSGKHF